jgi:hypothetical protein
MMSSETTYTFERPHRPLPIRIFNGVGRLLRRCGWRRPLNAERILALACRRTGLDDFGELDVREPLRRLIESVEQENQLTPLGRLLIRRELMQLACARLRIQAAIKEHPEVLHEPVDRPVFILGLGRTGSTLLHRLLAQDPQVRAPHYGETMDPASARSSADGSQVRQARRQFAWAAFLAPGLPSIHPLDAEAPEECRLLLMNTFRCPIFGQYGFSTAYVQWLEGRGLEEKLRIYEAYRQQLQLLQWRCPARRWVLKCPIHSWGLDALLQVFPDACVVQTHRDLAEVVPSTCSLLATFRGLYSDTVDPRQLGPLVIENVVSHRLDATRRARETHHGRMMDVLYRHLVRDPVGTVQEIYERFGLPWSAEMEKNIRDWLAHNPRDKHGRHRYSLEQFGLDRATVERMFPGYPESFMRSAAGERDAQGDARKRDQSLSQIG